MSAQPRGPPGSTLGAFFACTLASIPLPLVAPGALARAAGGQGADQAGRLPAADGPQVPPAVVPGECSGALCPGLPLAWGERVEQCLAAASHWPPTEQAICTQPSGASGGPYLCCGHTRLFPTPTPGQCGWHDILALTAHPRHWPNEESATAGSLALTSGVSVLRPTSPKAYWGGGGGKHAHSLLWPVSSPGSLATCQAAWPLHSCHRQLPSPAWSRKGSSCCRAPLCPTAASVLPPPRRGGQLAQPCKARA